MSSFSVSNSKTTGHKRLARKSVTNDDLRTTVEVGTDLYILNYTERSFVVMGDTLNHSNALVTLGGKYNTNLRIGNGWIFAKVREPSVLKYIETGEVEPYVYSKEDQARFEKRAAENAESNGITEQHLRKIFQEFREAFDTNEDYEGHSIIDVIYQLENRHLPCDTIKTTPKNKTPSPEEPTSKKPKRLARTVPESDPESDPESELENKVDYPDEYEYEDEE